jgi:hypothetical protein
VSAPAEVYTTQDAPRKLPKVPQALFERALDEMADMIRRERVPGRKRSEWISWHALKEPLKQMWREEAMLYIFTTTQLLYGENVKVALSQ